MPFKLPVPAPATAATASKFVKSCTAETVEPFLVETAELSILEVRLPLDLLTRTVPDPAPVPPAETLIAPTIGAKEAKSSCVICLFCSVYASVPLNQFLKNAVLSFEFLLKPLFALTSSLPFVEVMSVLLREDSTVESITFAIPIPLTPTFPDAPTEIKYSLDS